MTEPFRVGDQVEKYTGDYQLPGEIRAVLTTKAGKTRYVVEHEPGFLHIYSEANLRLSPAAGEGGEDKIPSAEFLIGGWLEKQADADGQIKVDAAKYEGVKLGVELALDWFRPSAADYLDNIEDRPDTPTPQAGE